MWGQSGADRFVFDGIKGGVDQIADFGGGDVLAIGVASAVGAGQEAEFVRLIDDGTDTTVQVDIDGAAGPAGFESIAVLDGVSGTTLAAMVSAGQIDLWHA